MRLAAYLAVLLLLTWTAVLGIQSFRLMRIYYEIETQCSIYPKPQRPFSSSSV